MTTIEAWADAIAQNYDLIIFDLDGTLVETKSGATFRKGADDWKFIGQRDQQVLALRAREVACAIATNQGGVAFGYLDPWEIGAAIYATARALDIGTGLVFWCFNHPKASIAEYRRESAARKPGPGMLNAAITCERAWRQDVQGRDMPLCRVLMVGDRDEDKGAAEAAGIAFCHADAFFSMDGKGAS